MCRKAVEGSHILKITRRQRVNLGPSSLNHSQRVVCESDDVQQTLNSGRRNEGVATEDEPHEPFIFRQALGDEVFEVLICKVRIVREV